jgi:hypothetical protein
MSNILFASEERIKRDSYLDANVEPDKIRTAMICIQDMIIDRVLGDCLADRVRELICTGEIGNAENEIYKVLLDDYLFKIFVYGVPMELGIPATFKDRNAGRVKAVDGEHYQSSALQEVKYVNEWYKTKVDYYINRAVKFIECNRGCFGCAPDCCDKTSPVNTGISGYYLAYPGTGIINRHYK